MEERERERFERILRRLREMEISEPKEREPDEASENDSFDKALIVPCKGRLAGHLIGWFTSGFQ